MPINCFIIEKSFDAVQLEQILCLNSGVVLLLKGTRTRAVQCTYILICGRQ